MNYIDNSFVDYSIVFDAKYLINKSKEQIKELFKNQIKVGVTNVYSYVMLIHNKEYNTDEFELKYKVIVNKNFNTIAIDTMLNNIVEDIACESNKCRMIGFKQPTLEIMLELFDPYIQSLVNEQYERWHVDREDLEQMCKLAMCILYKNGYYIHAKLLRKTFDNDVLKFVASKRYEKITKSLYEYISTETDNLTYEDIIEDERALNDITACEDVEYLNDMKEKVIEYIGQRNYDMLLNEYNNKCVSKYGSTMIRKIKEHFKRRNNE